MHLLQINYRVTISRDAYEEECAPAAQAIAEVPGLIWKAWVFNDEADIGGGIYLFETEEAMESYLKSSIVQGMKTSLVFSEISVNRFEVQAGLSELTRFVLPGSAQASKAPEGEQPELNEEAEGTERVVAE